MASPRFGVKSAALVLAVLVLTALLLAGVEWASQGPSDPERLVRSVTSDRLAEALAGWRTRPVEARLGGGIPHAPYDPDRFPLDSPSFSAAHRSLLQLEAELEGWQDGSSEIDLLAARLSLLRHDTAQAVRILEELTGLDPQNALAWSDLAAAHLEAASSADESFALIRALGAAERAVALAPELPEARFNRALALERLGLRKPAREAWREATELGSAADGWSEEARERAAALAGLEPREEWEEIRRRMLSEPAVWNRDETLELGERFPTAVRQLIGEDVLPRWGAAYEAGRMSEAGLWLGLARRLASSLADVTDERLYLEAVDVIERAHLQPTSLRLLARGHRRYAEAFGRYESFDIQGASRDFSEARWTHRQGGSPFELWSLFQLGRCAFQENDFLRSLAIFDSVLEKAGTNTYPSLRGRTHWMTGLVHDSAGRPAEALAAYRRALGQFESSGDQESAAAIHSLVASSERSLGTEGVTWTHSIEAIRGLPRVREPWRRTTILTETALAAAEFGEPGAAAVLIEARIAELDRTNHAVELAVIFRALAIVTIQAGRPHAALAALRQAADQVDQIGEPEVWKGLAGDIFALKGWLMREQDGEGALTALGQGIELYEDTGFKGRLAQLHHQRGLVHRALDRHEAAEADFLEGIAVREAQRKEIKDHALRLGHFATTRTLYQDLASLRAEQGRPAEALEAAERGRSRDLLDRLAVLGKRERLEILPAATPLSAREILRRLPARTVCLVYQVLEEHTLAWTVSREGIALKILPLKRQVLEAWTGRLNEQLEMGFDQQKLLDRSLARLSQELIKPLTLEELAPGSLVIVPDGPLWDVPFAALPDPRHDRSLGARLPVILSPSVSVFLQRRSVRPPAARVRTALVLGDPTPTSDSSYLPRLPGARSEALEVARVYGVVPLVGEKATREAFLATAAEAWVLHIAAHVEVNEQDPWLSSLILSSDVPARSGRLYAHEIIDLDLSRTELVVLTGCKTAWGEAAAGEGVSGLVHAFLAAGVSAVVASRWEIADEEVAGAVQDLHRMIAAGEEPAIALLRLRGEASTDDPVQRTSTVPELRLSLFGSGGLGTPASVHSLASRK